MLEVSDAVKSGFDKSKYVSRVSTAASCTSDKLSNDGECTLLGVEREAIEHSSDEEDDGWDDKKDGRGGDRF